MSPPFRVVLAGRPNVGKSALFNRLLGRRRSLVHDIPGMTRDVLEGEARLSDGRSYLLLDTGGYDPDQRAPVPVAVRERAVGAIRSANLVILVVDASEGLLAGDRDAARVIHEAGVAAVVAANKIDRREGSEGETEAWALGFAEVYGVSAEHGIGIDDLARAIGERLENRPAEADEGEKEPVNEIPIAVVGRPNVGKSSLVNALLGEDRAIVSEVAGTTRDSIDVVLQRDGRRFRLIDTAGIRRKSRTERGPEVLSVVQARKRIEECEVALLLLDASAEPTAQDAAVASEVETRGKGLVVLGNKWDLATRPDQDSAKGFRESVVERIPFARWAPILLVSARTGRGIGRVLSEAAAVAENRRRRISTGDLNRALGQDLRDAPPRSASGKSLKIFYVAQMGVAPPTFALVANREEPLHFSEHRRVENLLRRHADFSGTPLRISIRARSRPSKGKARGRKRKG